MRRLWLPHEWGLCGDLGHYQTLGHDHMLTYLGEMMPPGIMVSRSGRSALLYVVRSVKLKAFGYTGVRVLRPVFLSEAGATAFSGACGSSYNVPIRSMGSDRSDALGCVMRQLLEATCGRSW